MKILRPLLIMAIAPFVLIACYHSRPIVNVHSHKIIATKPVTLNQVRSRILATGRNNGWSMRVVKPGRIAANKTDGQYVANVDIFYNTKHYSIYYRNDKNLQYLGGDISSRYNKWINNLDRDIQQKLP